MAYCALVGSGFLHINLHYNLYEMNEFSWSVYAVNNSIVLLFFFHLQIWSAPNWILQIVFDNYVFFQFRLINILKLIRIIQLKAKSMQNQNKWLSRKSFCFRFIVLNWS